MNIRETWDFYTSWSILRDLRAPALWISIRIKRNRGAWPLVIGENTDSLVRSLYSASMLFAQQFTSLPCLAKYKKYVRAQNSLETFVLSAIVRKISSITSIGNPISCTYLNTHQIGDTFTYFESIAFAYKTIFSSFIRRKVKLFSKRICISTKNKT